MGNEKETNVNILRSTQQLGLTVVKRKNPLLYNLASKPLATPNKKACALCTGREAKTRLIDRVNHEISIHINNIGESRGDVLEVNLGGR
jgi:hypothetical protein